MSSKKTPVRVCSKKETFIGDIRRHPYRYLLLLPAALYTLIYGYLSYPYIVIAFKRFDFRLGVFGSPFNGLTNFEFFFRSNAAATVIWNTIYLNLLFLITGTVAALVLAIMLSEIRSRNFKRTSQSLMLFPHYLSWVVISYLIYGFFSMEFGMVNKIIERFGGEAVNWYTKAEAWPWILVVMRIWKGVGMSAVIYLAAITGIDRGIYEAAETDGAGRLQQIWHITIPLLLPTVCILTLLSIGRIMYGDFGMIYALIGDNGVLYSTTDIIDTYVFRALRQTGNPSQAMAVSLFQSALGFLMVFGSNRLAKKLFPDGALY